ncbi:flavin reductase family protein [Rheinheimera sp. 4Y26]|uniref:flavin reductase family protein n=1 Tax=Rheinheimera sp. 4Y26 TaxID=2977811 RepID=UPI0021B0BE28|nr:flavin reductase family protein [Rheinheimera sp. 4Y26]MCT6698282.1 flavin reductase family protein [Rheinheimera sp. 4Y26]
MIFDCLHTPPERLYPLLAGTVVPRPIAWLSSCDNQGHSNLAPFSFFQLVTDQPPTLMISINRHADGSQKDSSRNLQLCPELVVHLVTPELAGLMNATAASFAKNVSEIDALNINTIPAQQVRPPKVAASPVSFECKVVSLTPYPAHQPSCDILLAEVLCIDIADALLDEQHKLRHNELDLLARLGGLWYSHSRQPDNFQLARPASADAAVKSQTQADSNPD